MESDSCDQLRAQPWFVGEVTWLESRRSASVYARGFDVSAVTVKLWLDGKRNPSRMALVLAIAPKRGLYRRAQWLPAENVRKHQRSHDRRQGSHTNSRTRAGSSQGTS